MLHQLDKLHIAFEVEVRGVVDASRVCVPVGRAYPDAIDFNDVVPPKQLVDLLRHVLHILVRIVVFVSLKIYFVNDFPVVSDKPDIGVCASNIDSDRVRYLHIVHFFSAKVKNSIIITNKIILFLYLCEMFIKEISNIL